MIGARPSTACERLAERVRAITRAPADELTEVVARRVFDTLGALSARTAAGGLGPIGLEPIDPDAGLGEPLSTVRRLCAVARSSEVDDIDRLSCTTPGSCVVPATLVLAAERGTSGRALVAAVAAGYEAMVAVGEAIDGPLVVYRGIWPSYLGAPLATAAAAGLVLELDDDQTLNALAIAAARIVGIVGRPPREPTSRWFLYGCAAADGVGAALAAQRGMVGDPAVLDAALGMQTQDEFHEIAPGTEVAAACRVDVKPFCTARQAQAAVEAAQSAWEALGDVDAGAIEAIEVGVPEAYRAMIDQPQAGERITSIMSAQFQIAAALHEPDVLFDVARSRPRLGSAARALMAAVTVVADPELTPLFPAVWPARARIRMRDGSEAHRCVLEPDGTGAATPGWDWLEHKHTALRSFGDELPRAIATCRGLRPDASVPARELLDLTLHPVTTPNKETR